MFESVLKDFRYSFRSLVKNRGYALACILTLALGIGGVTAVFTVVNAILLTPLPYKEPNRLVMVWNRYGKVNSSNFHNSPPDFFDRKRESRTLESMAAIEETSLNLTGRGEAERIRTARVSPSLFSVLGVSPLFGRNFTAQEGEPSKNSVVMLSHGFWKRRFGSNPDLIGQTLSLNGSKFVVIGIMPAAFWYPNPETEIWTPLAFTPEQMSDDSRGGEYLSMIARIKPGIDFEKVQAEMSWIAAQVPERVPDRRTFLLQSGWGADVVPLTESIVGDVKPALLVLMGAVALLYFIACANTVNLFLARSTGRQKEIAIRAAIGADRSQLIRFILIEALLLSFAGGFGGVLLARWSTSLIPAIVPESLPRMNEIGLNGSVLFFVMAVSVVTGLFLGLIPALRLSISDLQQTLKVKSTGSSEKSVHRLRNALVITEVALTVVLATGAALLTKSFQQLVQVNPGFQTQDRTTLTLSLPRTQYPEDPQRIAFFQEMLGQIRTLPGVIAAGANASLPMQGENWTASFDIQGRDRSSGPPPGLEYRPVTTDYFRSMGIPVLRGREFNERDSAISPRVAVVDEKLAQRFWPEQDPIGKRIEFSGAEEWHEIVGVVGHVKNSNLETDGLEQVYLPHGQTPEPTMSIVVHATTSPSILIDGIRTTVGKLDPNLPLYQIGSMDQVVSVATAQSRFNTLLFAAFAIMALALAAVGIYGVISYSVNQRRKEIGIRMALGARPQNVLAMIVKQSMRVSFAGMILGVILSIALSRFLSSLLFQIQATDPAIYAGTTFVALLVALVACSLPARRAAHLDPLISLREE